MSERAEGFWWVRDPVNGWGMVRLRNGVGVIEIEGIGWSTTMYLDSKRIEWGPYLGKEPGDGGIGRAIELHQAYQDGDEGHTDPVFMLDMVGVALESYVAQPDEGLAERMRRKEAIALRARELRGEGERGDAEARANALGLTTKPYEWPDAEREREAGERLLAKLPGLHAK